MNLKRQQMSNTRKKNGKKKIKGKYDVGQVYSGGITGWISVYMHI